MTASSTELIEIDGQAGGGQLLRTALALSLATGQGFHLHHIRAQRPKDGLMRQHLCCVLAAQALCGAKVTGAVLRSGELTFIPGALLPRDLSFDIGSGGSTVLLMQALSCPLARAATRPCTLTVRGGTFCPMAPCFDFLRLTLQPCLRQMGYQLEFVEDTPAFFTTGGGQLRCLISGPLRKRRFEHHFYTAPRTLRAVILNVNLDSDIVRRMAATLRQNFAGLEIEVKTRYPIAGVGNALLFYLEDESGAQQVFSCIGRPGLRAESLAQSVCDEVHGYLKAQAPVETHLSDQLLVPLTLSGGGSFVMAKISAHFESCAAVIKRFTGKAVSCVAHDGHYLINVKATDE